MENELQHHGVKGQKWGIRRFQNKDGSLTSAGRKRRRKDGGDDAEEPKKSSSKTTKGKTETSEKKSKSKSEEKTDKKTDKKTEEVVDPAVKKKEVLETRSAKAIYENANLFTDDELRSAYNRLQLENNIKNLVPEERSKGEQYVDDFIKYGRKGADALDSGIKVYNNVAKIYNAFSDEGNLPIINVGNKGGDKKKNNNDDDDDDDNNSSKSNRDKRGNKDNKDDNSSKSNRDTKTDKGDKKSEGKKKDKKDGPEVTVENPRSSKKNREKYQGKNQSRYKKDEPDIIDMEYDSKSNTYKQGEKAVNDRWKDTPASAVVNPSSYNRGQQYIAGYLEEPKKKK